MVSATAIIEGIEATHQLDLIGDICIGRNNYYNTCKLTNELIRIRRIRKVLRQLRQ